MTTAGSGAVNPISAGQHMFGIGQGTAPSASDPTRYLGPDPGILQTNPYDRVSHTNYDYPEAVKYSTLFVKSTIEGFIMEDIEWYTTLALPWAQTDQMSVTWNEWHFDGHLADRVPHEGVSRLITSSKRQFKAHVVRRGLAFIQEADYAGTPEGEEQYARNVMSIAQAVQETQNHDTVFALLSSKNYYKLWQQRFGTAQLSLRQITDAEINLFGSVNLPEGSQTLEVVIEDHKRLMAKKKVFPNMIILWPGAAIYMSMVPPMRTEYWKAGPDGAMRREQGPTSVSSFRGMPVFEARDFDVYDNSPPVQLLTRPVQVSEYYTMRFDRRHEDTSDFTTKERGIVLYDENVDQWRKIGFLEAFEHARLFERDGKYANKLRDLLAKYHARGQRPESLGSMRDDERDEDSASSGGAKTMFLTAPDNEGEYMLIRYFGQMEIKHATERDMQHIGETIAAKLGKVSSEAWHDMIQLINDIESQPYQHEYWTALIGANTRDSLASNGEFVGEETPADVAMHWGMRSKQVQWKPNAFGGMRLPKDASMHDIGFPAGFANIPGLRTLAAEGNDPTSPWYSAGQRAKTSIGLMQYMLDTLRSHMPQSAAFDEKGRSPWFHRPDALTTFFENVIGVSRDPLFLASLPVAGGEGLADADTLERERTKRGTVDREKGMKWFVLPGTVAGIKGSETLVTRSATEGVEELRGILEGGEHDEDSRVVQLTTWGNVGPEGTVMFYSPTLGGVVTADVRVFGGALRFTPELRAFGMMPGDGSSTALRTQRAYYKVMRAVDDAATRRKFTDFVSQLGHVDPVRMWRVVYGMDTMREAELAAVINELHLTDGSTKARVAASKRRADQLSATAPARSAWDDMKPLSEAWEDTQPGDKGSLASMPALAFDEIAEDAQRALDIERDLIALSNLSEEDFGGGNSMSQFGARDVIDAAVVTDDDNQAEFDRLAAELDTVLGRIALAMDRQDPAQDDTRELLKNADQRARAAANKHRGKRLYVADTAKGILAGRYFRTPLTSSLHLLQSLSGMFGTRVAKPLVLPSDPASGHLAPYTWEGTEDVPMSIPGEVLGRTNYNPISSAIGRAMDAPNYATMSEVHRDHRLHSLDSTPFVLRHAQMQFEQSDNNVDSAASSSSRRLFNDDVDFDSDSDDDDDDAVSRIFSGAPAAPKRARIGAQHHHHMLPPSSSTTMQAVHTGEHRLTRTGAFAERWTQANKIADPLVKVCTKLMLMTKCDRAETWRNMIKNDILVPVDLIAWRAFITHDMASGILMKGGLETGANLHGGANVAKSNDGTSKLIYYNFTFRSKAIVWKERNVAIMENIKFEGYVGGMSTEFVTSIKDLDREDVDRPSIIVTAIPLNEPALPKMMDFSGRLQVPEANIRIDGPLKDHYSTAEYYNEHVWKLSERVTKKSPEHEDFFDRSDRVSVAAFQGTQYSYNRISGRYSKFIEPQGHLKRNMCYPGAAPILNGSAKSFVNYSYDTVHIE